MGTIPVRRRRGRLLVSLVVIMAIAGGAAWFFTRDDATPVGSGDAWAQRNSPLDTYRIEFPTGANAATRTVEIMGMMFDLHAVYVGDGGLERSAVGTVFIESELTRSGFTAEALEGDLGATILASGARAAFDSLGIEWESDADVNSELGTGILLTGNVPDRELAVRAFAVFDGLRLVGAVTTVPAADSNDADATIDRIVDSITPAG